MDALNCTILLNAHPLINRKPRRDHASLIILFLYFFYFLEKVKKQIKLRENWSIRVSTLAVAEDSFFKELQPDVFTFTPKGIKSKILSRKHIFFWEKKIVTLFFFIVENADNW
jgi:hypothetical protein